MNFYCRAKSPENHFLKTSQHTITKCNQMKDLPLILSTIVNVIVLNKELAPFQETGIQHFVPLVLYHFQIYDFVIILVLFIVIVIENSTLIELYHVQDTINFINNEGIPNLLKTLLPENLVTVFIVDPTLEINSISGITILLIDVHQDHLHVLHLLLDGLSKLYNQIPPNIKISSLKTTFES